MPLPGYTTSIGADFAPDSNIFRQIQKGLLRGAINSIPQYLINYAKSQTGRKSIAEEFMAGMKRKRAFSKVHPYDESRKRFKIDRRPRNTSSKSQNPAPGGPITTQYDYKVSRGKKRLSKRQKKWKRFVKKVHIATEANDKTQFLLEDHNAAAVVAGTIGISAQQVMPTVATGNDYNLQLSPVGNIATGPLLFVDNLIQQKAVTTVAAGSLAVATSLNDVKYKLLGASCTFSLKNITAFNNFIDIYECIASSDILDANFASARQAWQQCLADNLEADQLAARGNIQSNYTGSNPYMAPGFAKYWKVIKKTRVLVGAGAKVNYSFFTKGRMIYNNKVISKYAVKGLTKDIIIVCNPTYNGDTAAANQINVEWSKQYALKIDDLPGLQAQWGYHVTY